MQTMPCVARGELASEKEPLSWIRTQPDIPYFLDDAGRPWTPIGQNDAISWPELQGLFRRGDLAEVERYLRWLKTHGVTCLRLMLEYCHGEHRYLERPIGRFVPNMIRLWDDLFVLLEEVGLRVLLTPYDTFFMWIRWRDHPYNRAHGGPCASRREWLTCQTTRAAVKARLAFASDRWGASPAIFAWDLWNEIHSAHGGDDPATAAPFIDDVAASLRAFEIERHGRAHLQTVSIFGPELVKHPSLAEPIFRHPRLDFASIHLYETGTIDAPRDTVAPAVAVARLMRSAIAETDDGRPVLDTEHGPIHSFKDRKRTLPEAFDDEYFRHIQWAHLASGGAGGGMRWPNRHPHVLTHGMREAQSVLAGFSERIDWLGFRRRNLNAEVSCSGANVAVAACGDERQALIWLVRTDTIDREGLIDMTAVPIQVEVSVPGLVDGAYAIDAVDTRSGETIAHHSRRSANGLLTVEELPLSCDLAIAVRAAR